MPTKHFALRSRNRRRSTLYNRPPQTTLVFHGQIQTFVQQMTGEVVIAHSHITHIGSSLGAEETTPSEVEQSK